MLYIKVPDMNDSMSSLSIDGKEYILRLLTMRTMTIGVLDCMTGIKSPHHRHDKDCAEFPSAAFLHGYRDAGGDIWLSVGYGQDWREAFNDKTAEFVYIPNAELEE